MITYVHGDATQPVGEGNKLICHIVNNIGAWGRGFVLSLSKRYSAPEDYYRRWATGECVTPFCLGQIQLVEISTTLYVANMLAQDGIRSKDNPTPIRYGALNQCLERVQVFCAIYNCSVHMPRIGTGLGGGDWSEIEPIINECLTHYGIPVTVYDLT